MNSTHRLQGGEGTLRHYTGQWTDGFEWKIPLSLLGAIIATLEGFYGSLMWGFLALFVLDFMSGLMRSKHQGVPISSRKLRSSVTKLGAYMVLLTALIIASNHEPSFTPWVSVTYYYFMFTEFKSILENVNEMGVKVPSFLTGKVEEKIQRYNDVKDEEEKDKEEK